MLGAIYIGLSGLTAYSKGLQTISNNVANMNTPGFKATSVSFSDVFSYGEGGGSLTLTGNGQAAGSGVRFEGSDLDFRQGDLRQSANDLDLAIEGSGFLVLLADGKTYYARTGSFVIDKDGFVADRTTGHKLAMLDSSGRAVALNIEGRRSNVPKATTTVRFSDNLSSTAQQASVANIAVHNASGQKQVWQVKLESRGADAPGEWTVTVTDQNGAAVGQSTLKFNGSVVDPATSRITMTNGAPGADQFSVVLDFSQGVTSFSSGTVSTLRAASVDGHGLGELTAVTVEADGQVKLAYSNQQTELAGRVALAELSDPQQLEQIGNGLFEAKGGAEVMLGGSGDPGTGRLVSRQLEGSNVDLAQQFGDLILIQRGFQASSQVVSVSNDMIQQLFGMRGQG
ncbi:flagellar hook protein FlgE [Allosphingosinicella sp.]|jgi:flagellar hook protein FlgE|uniref:flagellar hook protein FlgE n=1 Tax=Allosphingosinicella sp. TaxID=2823234 RepID=UPI002F184359